MQYAQNRAAALRIKQCAGAASLFIAGARFGYHSADGSIAGETPPGKTPQLAHHDAAAAQCATGWFTPIADRFTPSLPFVHVDSRGNDDARWNIPLNG